MINLNGKTQTLLFPKNKDSWGPYTLVFHSELSQKNYSFLNLSDEGSRGYLTFTINSSNIAPGEYNYTIYDFEDEEVGIGLAVCNIEESSPTVKYYEISATIKEYVPKFRPIEPMKVFLPDGIEYSATTIPWKMVSAIPWAMTVYLAGRQIGQTIYGGTGTTEGEITIEPNLTREKITYLFAYGDEDGEYSFSETIMQDGLPFSVEIVAPDEVYASATSIPFEVRYSEWNTMRTGVVSLFKNGEKVQEMPYGMYPLVFASAFTIDANATYEEIHYRLEVKTIETPIYESVSAYTECVQLANEQPSYISITAPAVISYSSTSFSYSIESNKPCTIQFYKDNVYMGQTTTEGSYEGTFHISSNTGETDITYTISGSTNDGLATDSGTTIQTAYVPEQTISISTISPIDASSTTINYSVSSNYGGTVSLILNNTTIATQNVASGSVSGNFSISANTSSASTIYVLSAETLDHSTSDSVNVIQAGISNVSMALTATSPINWDDYYLYFNLTIIPDTERANIDLMSGGQVIMNKSGFYGGNLNFQIGQNTSFSTDREYVIVAKTMSEVEKARTTVIQNHQTETVSISGTTPIDASATTLHFTVITNNGCKVYLKQGNTVLSSKTYSSAGSQGDYFTIPANTGSTSITYTLYAESTLGQASATTNVIQNGVSPTPQDWSGKPFRIEMLEDGDIIWNVPTQLYYQVNGNTEQLLNGSITGLHNGDIVEFYVKSNNYSRYQGYSLSATTASFNVMGNILSLTYADYQNATSIPTTYQYDGLLSTTKVVNAQNLVLQATTTLNCCYQMLFAGCPNLITAPTILPATSLTQGCYASMFAFCPNLRTVPELPATTLAISCYYRMFADCTSLTMTPELPATTLVKFCYREMFKNCTSLITAPELPATTLTNDCYMDLFNGCSSLNYIKCLATDISASGCTMRWVENVSTTGTFIKANGMNNWGTGTDSIPNNWTVQNA